MKIVTKEEFDKIIERFPFGSSFYVPLNIAFHTGMRAAEICVLTWDCVDLENKQIKVEKKLYIKKKSGFLKLQKPKTPSVQ